MADDASSRTPPLVKASRTRVTVAVLTDSVPWFTLLWMIFMSELRLGYSNASAASSQPDASSLKAGIAIGLGGIVVAALSLMTPWSPPGATWGEWAAGLRTESPSWGNAASRLVGRMLKSSLIALALVGPKLTGWKSELFAQVVRVSVPAIGLWFVVRWIRRKLSSRLGSASEDSYEDDDVFDRPRTPERMVAACLIGHAILSVVQMCFVLASDSGAWSALDLWILVVRTPYFMFTMFAGIGLLLAGRARAVRERREFDMSELGLVLGFIVKPFWPVHAYRLAVRVLRAFPEARARASPGRPTVHAFVVVGAVGMAANGLLMILHEVLELEDVEAWSRRTDVLMHEGTVLVTATAVAVVLLRLRGVLSSSRRTQGIDAVAETFE